MHETRELILMTSFKLFLTKSFKEVTMRELVEKSGLSKGAFYYYFSSKENLFIEVIDTFFLASSAKIFESLPKHSLKEFYTNNCIKMSEFINQLIGKVDDDCDLSTQGITYYYLAFDAISRFPEFRVKISQYHKKETDTWVSVIRNARDKGEIETSLSDYELARLFINATDGSAVPLILEGKINSLSQEIMNLWNALYKVVKK